MEIIKFYKNNILGFLISVMVVVLIQSIVWIATEQMYLISFICLFGYFFIDMLMFKNIIYFVLK